MPETFRNSFPLAADPEAIVEFVRCAKKAQVWPVALPAAAGAPAPSVQPIDTAMLAAMLEEKLEEKLSRSLAAKLQEVLADNLQQIRRQQPNLRRGWAAGVAAVPKEKKAL
ncbi:hypothetical protein HXX76_003829 [Chlamydomonas incerta]|uniref:Uncharacterized protein n=1 Tax=Chlamydomonas incerta TaxID=51695 RepID=A0A835TLP6_CHLIN|nr:hypothetical protein HXX76_003829 [Chlamydomonas incerta]|eukprot:KAG2440976.1 hypothetical protein HXX76_003829 [Chlamydomonas incerta]